ncbi:MAG: acyl-CoA dehydrogenase, partial [Parafilimonas terrae]|nr:acyl-CoA dehydrogenase [Parafilimonas terrae]
LQAAIVKDLGSVFEQAIRDVARALVALDPDEPATRRFGEVLDRTVMSVPSFSLRGGAREILRGIIARGLGLR